MKVLGIQQLCTPFSARGCAIVCTVLSVLTAFASGAEPTDKNAEAGAKVFRDKCASCHGEKGQGVPDGRKEPLGGKTSLDELVKLIETTMPENDPEQCIGLEARQVAEYVYRQFYSQSSKQTVPREALARLTVDQYRNSVADVLARFAPTEAAIDDEPQRRQRERPPAPPPRPRPPILPGPGLKAQYFQSKGMSKADTLLIERVDGRLSFDFGKDSPGSGISADQFSIIWEGGLVAHDTGYYEFRIATQNGARLYLNLDPQQGLRKLRDDSSATGQRALVDQWVGSGQMREQAARVFLLGGRTYPIRVEFFKYLEKTASVELQWKPPHGVWSVLDQDYTTTVRPARVFVCQTVFPADDRSLGYERGNSISSEWRDAITRAASETATEVVNRLPALANLTDKTSDRDLQIRVFMQEFAATAFRRPLDGSERELFGKTLFENEPDIEIAIRRGVLMALLSPCFLYTNLPPVEGTDTQYLTASRLSFAMWDSIPDPALLQAAGEGRLESVDQVAAEAKRMLADPRSRFKIRGFFQDWLEMEERDIVKDKQLFPEFDESVVAFLRRSLEIFIEQVVWSPQSDYRQLLQANYLVLNDPLRYLYEDRSGEDSAGSRNAKPVDGSSGQKSAAPFQSVSFASDQRSGILTHPYLLSAFSYHNSTSPIHRGVFLTRNIVGRALNPPPQAIAFKDNEFAPDLTMREKITQLTRESACMSCHSVINPLGFALENFDAIGRWRTQEKAKPIDATSQYTTESGQILSVASARDVADYAVTSPTAHRAFVTHVFQYSVKQDPLAFDADLIARLATEFARDSFNIQNLWMQTAVISAKKSHSLPRDR